MEIKTNDDHVEIIFSDKTIVTTTWEEMINLQETISLIRAIAADENTREIHLAD